jgi:hypothetical protein
VMEGIALCTSIPHGTGLVNQPGVVLLIMHPSEGQMDQMNETIRNWRKPGKIRPGGHHGTYREE